MKKTTVYILLAVVLALSLCACGNDSMDNDAGLLPDAVPTESPVISTVPDAGTVPNAVPDDIPTADDGIVKDRDGIIEEEDNGPASTKESPRISPEIGVNK